MVVFRQLKILFPRTFHGVKRYGTTTIIESYPAGTSFVPGAAIKSSGTGDNTKGHEQMKAWQIDSFGSLDKLKLQSVSVPIIRKPNDILIKVMATSVNPLDVYMIGGYGNVALDTLRQIGYCFEEGTQPSPLILGRDFAGEVIAKGNNVCSNVMIGDIVYGVIPPHMQGCHAEKVVVNDSMVLRKPSHLNIAEASTILYTGLTAWCALQITGDMFLTTGEKKRVLVLGASGGVGTLAVQLLKAWGAEVVATCRTDAVPMVLDLKADVVVDYQGHEAMRDITNGGKYDIVLDASGTCNPVTYIPVLKEWSNAKYITLRPPVLKNTDSHGLMGGTVRNVMDLLVSNVYSGAPTKGTTVRWGFFMPINTGINEIGRLVSEKQITPIVEKTYKFDEMPAAYERIQQGHLRGKIAVTL